MQDKKQYSNRSAISNFVDLLVLLSTTENDLGLSSYSRYFLLIYELREGFFKKVVKF